MSAASPAPETQSDPAAQVPVWDVATRAFHWCLVGLIISAYVTRNYVQDPTLYLHRLNGYAILTLLLFRLLWGMVGSSTSRFAAFFPMPLPAIRYAVSLMKGRRLHYLGHNPLGAVLIFLMLLAVAAQALTGLFTSDDTLAQGPLYDHVSEAVSHKAGSYHAKGFWIILGLAALHIAANLIYQFVFRDHLVTAMVHGRKPASTYVDQQHARFAPISRAALCFLLSAFVVGCGVILSGDSLLH
ncbi:cytochrome b/b6 domain-containing protein [Lichenifustis flavocetrariae]|uniref:Cytochrome b/b6 domain-containing protein n=1 Tax=Lichenifustis flavocetrariae TaxID=2949735 RepID=A0AA42CJ99_9HYPH|nr:cytochrome b/b6 domain-containing protein [Lichenifustis flavocetrariae]MCW6509363.1 cytochrome b/b6 domain-containing protein [Lichenifustis flavocetrariae]